MFTVIRTPLIPVNIKLSIWRPKNQNWNRARDCFSSSVPLLVEFDMESLSQFIYFTCVLFVYLFMVYLTTQALSWLKLLVTGLSPRRPGFALRPDHVGFVVDKVAMGQVSLRVLRFSPVHISPPLLHTHLSPPHEMCHSPDQAVLYHALGPKLGASSLTRYLAGKEERSIYILTTLTVVQSILRWIMECFMNKELERIWKEEAVN
jgi:hypothetical protein